MEVSGEILHPPESTGELAELSFQGFFEPHGNSGVTLRRIVEPNSACSTSELLATP